MVDLMIIESYLNEDEIVDGSVTYHKRIVHRYDDIDVSEAIIHLDMAGLRFDSSEVASLPHGSTIVDSGTGERMEASGVILYAAEWEMHAIHAGVDTPRTPGWQARLHPGIKDGTYYPGDDASPFVMWTV